MISLTEKTGYFHASRCRKKSITSLASAHARCLVQCGRHIIVKWIITRGIIAIIRDAFKTIDSDGCEKERMHSNIPTKAVSHIFGESYPFERR